MYIRHGECYTKLHKVWTSIKQRSIHKENWLKDLKSVPLSMLLLVINIGWIKNFSQFFQ